MNISKVIVAHLRESLGVRVTTEMPEKRVLPIVTGVLPIVTVVRTGGGGNRFREQARYSIHSWAESEAAAYELSLAADEAMYELDAADVNIALVTQESLYSNIYPDGTRRWTGTYTITSNR